MAFSFFLDPVTVSATKPVLKGFQTAWFAMAFVCIGLETRFAELFTMQEGRPALAFPAAQTFNVLWTLLLAFVLFSGVLVAVPALN